MWFFYDCEKHQDQRNDDLSKILNNKDGYEIFHVKNWFYLNFFSFLLGYY